MGGALMFLAAYLLFSGLSTSLDFKIDKILQKQQLAQEEQGDLLARLAEARGREALAAASWQLGLKETTLADGYVDIRPSAADVAENLAKKE